MPVDLQLESITVGYVLKAEYFLPYNVSHFKPVYFDGFGERRRVVRAPEVLEFKSLFEEEKEGNPQFDDKPMDESDEGMSKSTENTLVSSRWNLYKAIEQTLKG